MSEIQVGDTVLVRQQKENKFSTKFNPMPYNVTVRKGARVTVCRNGHFITRNVSFFKKIPDNKDQYILDENQHNYCFDFDEEQNPVHQQEQERHRYPVRIRNPVQRYGHNVFEK